MSPAETPQPDVPVTLPTLAMNERRVLGVLVEKAKTTPDAYPLSINALTTGCNQKSNRDPVLDLQDLDVETALASCQKTLLVTRITGGSRVERWRHNLYDAWKVNKVELAVLAELLLRGAQTEGELRAGANRMEPIDDLDALRAVLRTLAERKMVVYLTPEGRRGTTITHGFHAPKELEHLRSGHLRDDEAPATTQSTAPVTAGQLEAGKPNPMEIQFADLKSQVASLQRQVTELQVSVISLTDQLRGLKEALGT